MPTPGSTKSDSPNRLVRYECVACRAQYDNAQAPCPNCGGSQYYKVPVPTILQRAETAAYFLAAGWFTYRVLVFHFSRISGYARFHLGAHSWADLLLFLLSVPLYLAACFAIMWKVKVFDRRFPSIARGDSRGDLWVLLAMASILTVGAAVTFELLYTVFQD